ncbi:uncharacterized protein LOC111051614 [Nilaparvata lugens]|uniref:uncharacterized protein LOC111051614 n=1 Tax=Nilaparvata lugens TaxID=108931 RepID=UPI00193E9D0A|nr:uncharacterized protein LOC111051614 [Nilaparvata lugens]
MSPITLVFLLASWLHCCSANSIVTRYTQLNHDEPTNAIKETTMTSQQDQFQAEDKDMLWDHLRGIDTEDHLRGIDSEEMLGEDKASRDSGAGYWLLRLGQTTTDEPVVSTTNASGSPADKNMSPDSTKSTEAGEVTTVNNNLNILPPSMVEKSDSKVSNKLSLSMVESHSKLNNDLPLSMTHSKVNENKSQDEPSPSIVLKDLSMIEKSHSKAKSTVVNENKSQEKPSPSVVLSEDKQKRVLLVEAELKERDTFVDSEEEVFEETNEILRERQKFNERIIKDFNEERLFDSDEQEKEEEEEEEVEESERRAPFYGERGFPGLEDNDIGDSPFKMWDQSSDEQEKLIEEMVVHNETALLEAARLSVSSGDQLQPSGRWFLLLLAGNSTIVRLRQKDFAKYLKLNLAARLSLEYDEVRVNRVVLAPPRLMVNVSVVPSNENGVEDLDEELEMDDRVFGEEEAPLHKLAETNATLLELSGEEYHVVRFLSLRSQQPVSLDDVPSATSMIVNDRHTDIETVIYVAVGGACAAVILVTALMALFRYLRTLNIDWPWHRSKPLFNSLPRHQRMSDETLPSIGGPLTVIYSGSFVDRSGPPSGNWLEDHASMLAEDPASEGPVYTFAANSILTDALMTDAGLTPDSPRQPKPDSKLHILGCRPGHLLIPQRSPANHPRLNRVTAVDNPNYQS